MDALRREGLTFSSDGRLIVENVEARVPLFASSLLCGKEKEEQPKMFSHGAEKPKASEARWKNFGPCPRLSQLAMQRKARAEADGKCLESLLQPGQAESQGRPEGSPSHQGPGWRPQHRGRIHFAKDSYKPGRKKAQGDAKRKAP